MDSDRISNEVGNLQTYDIGRKMQQTGRCNKKDVTMFYYKDVVSEWLISGRNNNGYSLN